MVGKERFLLEGKVAQNLNISFTNLISYTERGGRQMFKGVIALI